MDRVDEKTGFVDCCSKDGTIFFVEDGNHLRVVDDNDDDDVDDGCLDVMVKIWRMMLEMLREMGGSAAAGKVGKSWSCHA